jgi:hypothetical protein
MCAWLMGWSVPASFTITTTLAVSLLRFSLWAWIERLRLAKSRRLVATHAAKKSLVCCFENMGWNLLAQYLLTG